MPDKKPTKPKSETPQKETPQKETAYSVYNSTDTVVVIGGHRIRSNETFYPVTESEKAAALTACPKGLVFRPLK